MKKYLLLFLFLYTSAGAQNTSNPVVEFDHAFLQISGFVSEPSLGGLTDPQYKLAIKSVVNKNLDLKLSIGATQLLYRPNWVTSAQEKLSLVDATATMHTNYLDFYAGQFLIPFGLEGTATETELYFQRSLLYERGFFILRDYGVGVKAQSQGFSFNLAAHGGEAGGTYNSDGKIFVTGQWSYQTPFQTAIGLSLTEGKYDFTKLRGANLFFRFNFVNIKIDLEASSFQSLVGASQTDWLSWHGDLIYNLSDEVNLLGRYEQYNPNIKQVQNVLGRGTLTLEWHNKDSTSRLFFSFLKNNESLSESPNDEFRLTWRIATL